MIEINSVEQVLSVSKASAIDLCLNRDAEDDAFMSSAWSLAESIASVGSDPLGYILDDLNIRRYGDELGLKGMEKLASLSMEQRHLRWRGGVPPLLDAVDRLRGMVAGKIRVGLGLDEPKTNDWRKWLWQTFQTLEVGPLPTASFQGDKWTHIAMFMSFNFGSLPTTAQQFCSHPSFEQLSPFWQEFCRWHATEEPSQTLLSLLQDDQVALGKRKACLLLSWTRPAAPVDNLVSMTLENRALLEADVEYRGSGQLPLMPRWNPTKRRWQDVLKDIESKAKGLPSKHKERASEWEKIVRLVEEMLCASAIVDSAKTQLNKLLSPGLRAVVYSHGPGERQVLANTLIALQAHPSGTNRVVREWDTCAFDDSRESLQQAIEKKHSDVCCVLGSHVHIKELERWQDVDLLDRVVRAVFGVGDICLVGSQALGIDGVAVGDGRIASELLQDGLLFTIPTLDERSGDVAAYLTDEDKKRLGLEGLAAVRKLKLLSVDDLFFVVRHVIASNAVAPTVEDVQKAYTFLCPGKSHLAQAKDYATIKNLAKSTYYDGEDSHISDDTLLGWINRYEELSAMAEPPKENRGRGITITLPKTAYFEWLGREFRGKYCDHKSSSRM